MGEIRPYIAVIIAISIGLSIAIAAAFFIVQMKNKKKNDEKIMKKLNNGNVDSEIQRLGLSVRTTSDKKVSFEGSTHETIDAATIVTPRNQTAVVERFTAEEMKRATGDFGSGNHIEGSVYHGRLNGKDLAIKRVTQETFSNLDPGLFSLHHPNVVRLIGTCEEEIESSFFVVFEYAKNGSLRDWLHGGLAIKSHFIASCYCFLTWTQRLKICLDVATALQYIHNVIEPCRIHGNIKSKNIFLDEDFNAKVSNFGLEKKITTDNLESQKVDIFDYGVLVLEVLSGHMEITGPNEKVKAILGSKNVEEEMREWMDSALGEKYGHEEAVELANLARLCTEEDVGLRPNAEEIVETMSKLVGESDRGGFGECSLVISESFSMPLMVKEE